MRALSAWLHSNHGSSLKGAKATTELWPPKPKELEIATSTLCCFFSLGMVSSSPTSSMMLS